MRLTSSRRSQLLTAASAAVLVAGALSSSVVFANPGDVRVTNDFVAGSYQYSGGDPNYTYTDDVLKGCSTNHERQNEPSVEADPRNPSLLLASANDYCAVPVNNTIWLGYYRSETGGQSWKDSYVPGYPGDTSLASHRAQVNTTSAGDPVIAWDNSGNAYFGAEASGSETSFKKTNGDIWVARYQNPGGPSGAPANDASLFSYSRTIAQGSQAPNLLGKFNDKTAIEADRSGACGGAVYFAFARFTAGKISAIWFTRSTDQGNTWSTLQNISGTVHNVQFPDISVTHNGDVYVTYRQFGDVSAPSTDSVNFTVSHDCGKTFGKNQTLATFVHYDAQDKTLTGADARDCGDGSSACQSGYTFFRQDSQVRATADQSDSHNVVYVVYNATKPGTQVLTGTSYGTVVSGTGSQSGVYFTTIASGVGQGNGSLVDDQAKGHQFFPDVTVGGQMIHLIWYDSRADSSYSPKLPNGDTTAGRNSGLALNVFATKASESSVDSGGPIFSQASKISEMGTNGNWEQFGGRTIPFAGDYLWVTSLADGSAYVVWTDWRNTKAGTDIRSSEAGEPKGENFDVLQCRATPTSPDTCQTAGGKDQDIYGHAIP